jgi:hypothetical protein
MGSREGLTLQQKALEALRSSTKMLKVASVLRRQGNRTEADRLQNEARAQRTISTLLMAEAQNRENEARLARDGAANNSRIGTSESINSY